MPITFRSIRAPQYWWVVIAISLVVGVISLILYLLPPSRDTFIRVLGMDGKHGLINGDGRWLTKPTWDAVVDWRRCGNPKSSYLWEVRKGGTWQEINLLTGETLRQWKEKNWTPTPVIPNSKPFDQPSFAPSPSEPAAPTPDSFDASPASNPSDPVPTPNPFDATTTAPESPEQNPFYCGSDVDLSSQGPESNQGAKEAACPLSDDGVPTIQKLASQWDEFKPSTSFRRTYMEPARRSSQERVDEESGSDLDLPHVRVRKGDKWGIIDRMGNCIIDVRWDYIFGFDTRGNTIVKRDGKWGVLDHEGNVIIEVEWDAVSKFQFSHAKFLMDEQGPLLDFAASHFMVERDEKWGLFDEEGSQITPVKWDKIVKMDSALAMVKVENKWGLIGYEGEEVIPVEWDRISPYVDFLLESEVERLEWYVLDEIYFEQFIVERNGKKGVVDKDNQLLAAPEWDEIVSIDSDYMGKGDFTLAMRNGKYGWVDPSGKTIIPPEWESIWILPLDQEWGWGKDRFDQDQHVRMLKGNLLGVFDCRGEQLFTLENGRCGLFDRNGLAWFDLCGPDDASRDAIEGWIDKSGNRVITLPGENWKVEDKSYYFTDHFPDDRCTCKIYYVATKEVESKWMDKLLAKIDHWLTGNATPVRQTSTLCLCYDAKGKLIWSNAWISYEHRCLMAMGVSMVLLVLSGRETLFARRGSNLPKPGRRG